MSLLTDFQRLIRETHLALAAKFSPDDIHAALAPQLVSNFDSAEEASLFAAFLAEWGYTVTTTVLHSTGDVVAISDDGLRLVATEPLIRVEGKLQ